jgi:23S rRNA (adenine2503-C2)-methyltransferase
MLPAWSLLPGDLRALGFSGDATHLYSRIFRPRMWRGEQPVLGRAAAVLEGRLDFTLPLIAHQQSSSDGSTKVLLTLGDGARVEAVHMPRAVKNPRVTLCISSQVGCAMGCTFCATGAMGLVRNLSAAEIVGQVMVLMHALGPQRPQDVSLVFMGMGEPLHNLDAVTRAITVMCDPAGLGLSSSRMTVSTSGLVPAIDQLATFRPRPLLALSLNATTDVARARTMPVARKWNLAALREALVRWTQASREKVTVEYVLLAGQNDADADADRLASWVSDFHHNLNVIPFNAYPGAVFRESAQERAAAFVKRLYERGCRVTVRRTRGRDVLGACGTLATDSVKVAQRIPLVSV